MQITMTRIFAILFLFTLSTPLFAKDNNTPVPFTFADRDRLMRNEQKIDALRNEMIVKFEGVDKQFNGVDKQFENVNKQFKSVDKRFDSLEKEMNYKFENQQKQLDRIYNLMLFLLGGMMSLMGFVIYDRRTAINPVKKEQQKMADEIYELKKQNNILTEILKKAGML